MIPRTLIHYGNSSFVKSKFTDPIAAPTRSFTKPIGGFWASPIKSTLGWIDLIKVNASKNLIEWEDYEEIVKNYFFLELLAPEKRCYVINTEEDLNELPKLELVGTLFGSVCLDYASIKQHYDAIYLSKEGLNKTKDSKPLNTNDWECECVLILNPYCIDTEIKAVL